MRIEATTRSASFLSPLSALAAGLAMLFWGVSASFAQTGLIEPTEDGLTLPAVSSETGDTTHDDPSNQAAPDEQLFTINFRDADILEVLEAYSNLLNVNVVPGEGVSGMVTVLSPGPVTRLQAVNLLHSILKLIHFLFRL